MRRNPYPERKGTSIEIKGKIEKQPSSPQPAKCPSASHGAWLFENTKICRHKTTTRIQESMYFGVHVFLFSFQDIPSHTIFLKTQQPFSRKPPQSIPSPEGKKQGGFNFQRQLFRKNI